MTRSFGVTKLAIVMRPAHLVVIIAILAYVARYSAAQSPPATTGPQGPPEEDSWSDQLAASFQIIQLHQRAIKLHSQGKFQEAVPYAERCLALIEKTLGPTDPLVGRSLSNLADLYWRLGAYDKAEPLLVRAFDIREKGLKPTDPELAHGLNGLAALYQAKGAYEKAEPLFVRALDIREKALGPMDVEVAQGLNNLAVFYKTQGAYGKAEPLLVRALEIHENARGPTHPDVALSLNNLAALYQDEGAYDKAQPLYVRALNIREKTLGPMHPDLALGLNNLALLYQDLGAYDKARPLYVRARDIYEKALGPMHPDVAQSLNNLAELYRAQGMYGKAAPLYVRALEIRDKVLGPMHPGVAESLNNLAELYRVQGEYGKAKPHYIRALEIAAKTLGMHPTVAKILNNFALLYQAQGANELAVPLLSRAADIRERQLRDELAPLPAPRKRALMALLQGGTDRVVSAHVDAMPHSDRALELALTTVLRRKGRILDSLLDNDAALRAHLTPVLRDQLDRLNQARRELVAQLYGPTGPRSAANRTAITAARARIDALESALSAASTAFRSQAEPVTVAKIQAALLPSAALVEIARYRRFDPRQAKQHWQEERYVAYLLLPSGPPQWVALGAAAPIDAEVDAMLATMHDNVPAETTKAALQRLDALVFAPIRAQLANISHVILAPDGKLNLVPFEALVDPQGHYALENYLVSYVTTGRDLLRFATPHRPQSSAVIVAGPDYGPLPSPGGPGVVSFMPLAGAVAEATDLQPYFPTAPLTGGKATKSALAALTGPAMLHIATHGFYARDPGPRLTQPTPALAATSALRADPAPAGATRFAQCEALRGMFVDCGTSLLLPPSRSEDPGDGLDRAGLAMAGANQGAGGIVTAREIAGFDWWGTQLVVLSACETGVGVMSSGDGVYGLRRALVLAGAESQVVSLWRVNDVSTQALMRDYYGELAHGTGRAEALRQAKLHLLRQPRYAHPYYWAAFIPAGDWTPLDKNTLHRQEPTR